MTMITVRDSFYVAETGLLTVGQSYDIDSSLAGMMVRAGKALYVGVDPNTQGLQPLFFDPRSGSAAVSGDGFSSIDFGSVRTLYKQKENFRTANGTVLDDMTSAATNWNNLTNCTIANDTTYLKEDLGFSNALKITSTSATGIAVRRNISGVTITGNIYIWVYCPAEPTAAFAFNLWLSNNALSAGAFSATVNQYHQFFGGPGGTRNLRQGWNCLSVNVAEDGTTQPQGGGKITTTAIGGQTLASPINSIQIGINAIASGEVFYIGGIFYGAQASSPKVLMNWDDGNDTQWTIFNIFRSRGITGSLSIIPRKIGAAGSLTLAQLRTIYDWGWDVVAHPHESTDVIPLTSLSVAAATAEIVAAKQWMQDNGFTRRLDTMVWPQNAANNTLVAVAQGLGYKVARESTNRNIMLSQGIDNPMRLGSGDLGGITLATAIKLLDSAILYKSLIIIYGHKLVGTATSPASGGAAPGDTYTWNQSDYIALADNIAAKVAAGTIKDVNYSTVIENCRV